MTDTPKHPADVRWQIAYVKFEPAVEQPSAADCAGHDCKLIWVVREDWERFMDWQRESGVRGDATPLTAWHFHAWRGLTRWVGMAKRAPFVTGHPLTEPGELWFEFGPTEAEALAAVRRSVVQ